MVSINTYSLVKRVRVEYASYILSTGYEKKPMDLCSCESEEYGHGVGSGVNTTLLSDTL